MLLTLENGVVSAGNPAKIVENGVISAGNPDKIIDNGVSLVRVLWVDASGQHRCRVIFLFPLSLSKLLFNFLYFCFSSTF